jgi:aspartyl protease family protein
MRALVIALCALALGGVAAAQQVALGGSIGERTALLVIDGQPRAVAVGASVEGVRLIALRGHEAEVEIAGQRRVLRLGAAPVAVGGGVAPRDTAAIVLTAGPGGHFTTLGAINGRPVQFMVDTGATHVALGRDEAERLGVDWRAGRPGVVRTANGDVTSHTVTLRSVRVGDVEVAQVSATVLPGTLPMALLGNSFLTRFQMTRENDVLRLQRRP